MVLFVGVKLKSIHNQQNNSLKMKELIRPTKINKIKHG